MREPFHRLLSTPPSATRTSGAAGIARRPVPVPAILVRPVSVPAILFRLGPRALVRFPRPDGGDPLADRDLQTPLRAGVVVEVGDRYLGQSFADRFLDRAQVVLLVGRDEGERIADFAGARSSSDPVDV